MRIAACAILIKKGHVLLGKRSANREYYPDAWDVFGGHALLNESPEETLVRELQEELAVTPTNFYLATVVKEPKPESYGEGEFYIFIVNEWLGDIRLNNTEHQCVDWFNLEQAARLDLADAAILPLLKTIQELNSAE